MSWDVQQERFSCSVPGVLFGSWLGVSGNGPLDSGKDKTWHPVLLEALYTLSSESSARLEARRVCQT